MLTQENSIIDFVQNLEDIEILFTSMSPATVDFFGNAFNTTRFTSKVKNLDWQLGDTLQVFGDRYSATSERHAAHIINDGKPAAEESDEIQNRQVQCKMLSLDWVHADYKGYRNVGFRELIVALSVAPHESLFSTELCITLVEHFWDYYFKRVFFAGFVPYLLYFGCTIFYVSKWGVEGIDEDDIWKPTLEFFMRWIIIASVIYFALFEFVAMIRDGWGYLTDPFNYFDWSAFILNFYCTIASVWYPVHAPTHPDSVEGECGGDDDRRLLSDDQSDEQVGSWVNPEDDNENFHRRRAMAALLVFLMWMKTFYWMRLFGPTSFYVRLIQETIMDIGYFLILFIFILLTFGNTLLIMNYGRPDDSQVFADIFGITFLNTLVNQYMLSLGEFDTENYLAAGDDVIVWIVFIGTTFIT